MMNVAAIAITAEAAFAASRAEIIIYGKRIYRFCRVDTVELDFVVPWMHIKEQQP
jgi:hypothetical protein